MLDELQEHVESIDMANGKFLHSFVRFLFCDDICGFGGLYLWYLTDNMQMSDFLVLKHI